MFYNSFQARQSGNDNSVNRKFLIFDEWAAFVLSRTDKKEQERVKSVLSTLLMMGRGVQHHVIIGLQRADAQLFPLGGRDQFGAIIALGNLSREQKLMLFPDEREKMDEVNGRGQGYLSFDGDVDGLKRIVVPTVTDHEKLNAAIRRGLNR
jgi:DNA segregation ATPase FtsK/SpoIIIE-like protein